MMHGIGRVARQLGRSGFFARVSVDCTAHDCEPGPPFCALDDDVPRAWKAAAIVGAAWAIEVAGVRAVCRITTISGMLKDTNPTIVAIASARAVWATVGFTPSESLRQQVDQAVSSSHEVPEGQLGLPRLTGAPDPRD